MFNLEIKRIPLRSIVLSAYPFVVFVFTLLQAFLGLGDLLDPEAGLFKAIMQVLLYGIINTGVIVLFTMFAAIIYNILVNFGIRGLRITLAEIEEPLEEEVNVEEVKEEQPSQEENK